MFKADFLDSKLRISSGNFAVSLEDNLKTISDGERRSVLDPGTAFCTSSINCGATSFVFTTSLTFFLCNSK